jgi:hypothetical protein
MNLRALLVLTALAGSALVALRRLDLDEDFERTYDGIRPPPRGRGPLLDGEGRSTTTEGPARPGPTSRDHEAREGYGPVVQPADNSTSGTIVGETHYSPAEGTA